MTIIDPNSLGSMTTNISAYIPTTGGNYIIPSTANISGTYFQPYGTYSMSANSAQTSIIMAIQPFTNKESSETKIFRSSVYFNEDIYSQYHLKVWRETNSPWNDDNYINKKMDVSRGSIGHLYFYEECDLIAFEQWWKSYINFFDSIDYTTSYFPSLKKGKINGYFIKGKDADVDWKWIVKNISEGAIRADNGWLFKTDRDATLFTLIGDNN